MAQVLLQKEHAAPPVKPRPEILCPVDPKLEAPSLPSSSLKLPQSRAKDEQPSAIDRAAGQQDALDASGQLAEEVVVPARGDGARDSVQPSENW